MPTKRNLVVAGAVNALFLVGVVIGVWIRGREMGPTETIAVLQTLVLADTLWILWHYTGATLRLATTAETQVAIMKAQFWDEKLEELIMRKPIVFTDREPSGETRISNLGSALAANVWYLADDGKNPLPLGSLGEGQSRIMSFEVADRHILIAEARQMPAGTARKFTPTLNAWDGRVFAHGFIQRPKEALEHRGSMKDYLRKSPGLIEKLRAFDPSTYDSDQP